MIQVHQISFSYDELSVLEKVSFRVERGEFVFLVGPSGSGKTTLLRLLYADLAPVGGELSVVGQQLTELNKVNLPYFRQKIGVVFQDFKLLADKTVKENLALPQKLVGTAPRLLRDNVNELLHQMGLSHHQNARPAEISNNERRKLAIARAIINKPLSKLGYPVVQLGNIPSAKLAILLIWVNTCIYLFNLVQAFCHTCIYNSFYKGRCTKV